MRGPGYDLAGRLASRVAERACRSVGTSTRLNLGVVVRIRPGPNSVPSIWRGTDLTHQTRTQTDDGCSSDVGSRQRMATRFEALSLKIACSMRARSL